MKNTTMITIYLVFTLALNVSLLAANSTDIDQECLARWNRFLDNCRAGAERVYNNTIAKLNSNSPDYGLRLAEAECKLAEDQLDCQRSFHQGVEECLPE